MESLTETELVRARWRRHLRAEALDTTDQPDFARRGLANRVRDLAFRLLILPYDPDIEQFETDESVSHLKDHQNMEIGNGTIHFGTWVTPSAHATAHVARPRDDAPWERFVAVHRNGAVELGLSDRNSQYAEDSDPRYVQLIAAASFSWATLELAREINPEANDQPRLLAVALPDAADALLDNLAAGYRAPGSHYNQIPGCPDAHLLWHIELDRLPADLDGTHALALNIASRLLEAWGVTSTLHLDGEGSFTDQLNVHRAAQ